MIHQSVDYGEKTRKNAFKCRVMVSDKRRRAINRKELQSISVFSFRFSQKMDFIPQEPTLILQA